MEQFKKGLSNQRKSLLGLSFKENMKSIEDPRNFPDAPGVVTFVRDTGGYLKVWAHFFEVKEAFTNIRMFSMDDHFL